MQKKAIISMDVEDWHHVDYFRNNLTDSQKEYSMLDGLNNFIQLIDDNQIKSSFFVLSDIVKRVSPEMTYLANDNHDIASHGMSHNLPLRQTIEDFKKDIYESKNTIENTIQSEVVGYRAPCFAIDDEKHALLRKTGYLYGSSKISFELNSLYGSLSMSSFDNISPWIYRKGDFIEFELSVHNYYGKRLPVSGGGYIRIFPWLAMKRFISSYLQQNNFYIFYIHPYEFSSKSLPNLNCSMLKKARFKLGHNSVRSKMQMLIDLLREKDYSFTTFQDYRLELLNTYAKNSSNL